MYITFHVVLQMLKTAGQETSFLDFVSIVVVWSGLFQHIVEDKEIKKLSNFLHDFYKTLALIWQKNKLIACMVGVQLCLLLEVKYLAQGHPDGITADRTKN